MDLIEGAPAASAGHLPIDRRQIDVYRLGHWLTDALQRDDVSATAQEALRAVETADLLISATPVFRGSSPGMFKHFFDLVGQYDLAANPVLMTATGEGERRPLIFDHALGPLFGFFQALFLPVSIFASSNYFDGTLLLNPRVRSRIEVAVADAVLSRAHCDLSRQTR